MTAFGRAAAAGAATGGAPGPYHPAALGYQPGGGGGVFPGHPGGLGGFHGGVGGIPGLGGPPGGGSTLRSGCDVLEHTCTYILCCGTKGLLSKFPSRAKRIDVISRFIFPLIFAIFNLAYWLYYLFAKSQSPQLET